MEVVAKYFDEFAAHFQPATAIEKRTCEQLANAHAAWDLSKPGSIEWDRLISGCKQLAADLQDQCEQRRRLQLVDRYRQLDEREAHLVHTAQKLQALMHEHQRTPPVVEPAAPAPAPDIWPDLPLDAQERPVPAEEASQGQPEISLPVATGEADAARIDPQPETSAPEPQPQPEPCAYCHWPVAVCESFRKAVDAERYSRANGTYPERVAAINALHALGNYEGWLSLHHDDPIEVRYRDERATLDMWQQWQQWQPSSSRRFRRRTV